ncbi:hypothetical protein DFH09DRAFT_1339797 [Mycena vulgaris]|nr:hypothetical protein DFH09DRAFT_1339797 [Mycena vulgaris]
MANNTALWRYLLAAHMKEGQPISFMQRTTIALFEPLKEPQYLTSWDDRHRYQEANQGDFEEEDERSEGPSSSQPSSSSASFPPSSSPPSSQSSSSSTSSINSTIASLRVQAMLLPDPRISTVPIRALPRRPTSIGGGTALEGERRLNPFYKLSVANARKTADVELMEYLHQIDSSGVLQDDPESHPAWDTNNVHRVLQVYDSRIYPQCLLRTNDFLQYLYKPVGQAIRELNCALGIPYHDYASLIRCNISCDCCRNQFSFHGYNAHILDDRFVLTFLVVDTIDSMDDNTFHFRSFRDDKYPKKVGETLDTAVGSALLEWNSRLGVPTDVWMTISTAIQITIAMTKAKSSLRRVEIDFMSIVLLQKYLVQRGSSSFNLSTGDHGSQLCRRSPSPHGGATALAASLKQSKQRAHLYSTMPLAHPSKIFREPSTFLFDAEGARKQRNSGDIVVYCPSLRAVIKIAWPLINGHPVPPNFLLPYLHSLGLHWACFCAMHGAIVPCRIITWSGTGTYAFCHYSSARCQFFLDLDSLHQSTTRHEAYTPIGSGVLSPDSHLARYLLADDDQSNAEPLENALYLPGYLGECEESVRQLGGIVLGDPSLRLDGYLMMAEQNSANPGAFHYLLSLKA